MRYIKPFIIIRESFQEENINSLLEIIKSKYGDDHLNQLRLAKDLRSITTKRKWLEFVLDALNEDDREYFDKSFIENYLEKYSKDFVKYIKSKLVPKSVESDFSKWIDNAVKFNPNYHNNGSSSKKYLGD